jgi:hypothetical protein
MSIPIQSKFSAVQDRRPVPTSLIPGELTVGTHTSSPGVYFRDSDNNLVKVGPTHIGASAPTPTNHAVILKGETWWDGNSMRIWSGTQWEITNRLSTDFPLPFSFPEIQLSNPTGSSISFSQGAVVLSDNSDNRLSVKATSVITKSISTWAAGDGNGSLIGGSITNNTWYHVFCIHNPTASLTDFAIAPTLTPSLPSGYTFKRRLGSLLINAASFITKFFQQGSLFLLEEPLYDLIGVRVPTTKTNYKVSAPPNVISNVKGILSPGLAEVGSTLAVNAFNPSIVLVAGASPGQARGANQAYSSLNYLGTDYVVSSHPAWITNASSELAFQSSGTYRNSVGSTTFLTYGWEDLSLVRGL